MHRRLLLVALPSALAACRNAPWADPAQAPASRAVVFFTADSAGLDQAAQGAIRQAADMARANPSALVHVRGFAAPDTGTVTFNRVLARARAQAVADSLVSSGVPVGRIRIESRGEVPYELVPTEARRVEIVIGT